MTACFYIKIYTWIFIDTLFIIAPSWKQLRWSSTGEWLNKLWHISTTEHSSAINRNELSIQPTTLMKIWRIVLNGGKNSKPGPKVYILCFHLCNILKQQNYRNGEQISGCQVLRKEWGQKGNEFDCKRITRGACVVMGLFCILTASMSVSWLGNWTLALPVGAIEGIGIQDTWDIAALFLTSAYQFTIASR